MNFALYERLDSTTSGLMVSRKSASRATATAFSRAATAEAVTGAARMQRGRGTSESLGCLQTLPGDPISLRPSNFRAGMGQEVTHITQI